MNGGVLPFVFGPTLSVGCKFAVKCSCGFSSDFTCGVQFLLRIPEANSVRFRSSDPMASPLDRLGHESESNTHHELRRAIGDRVDELVMSFDSSQMA